jgi:hypothetical protein
VPTTYFEEESRNVLPSFSVTRAGDAADAAGEVELLVLVVE